MSSSSLYSSFLILKKIVKKKSLKKQNSKSKLPLATPIRERGTTEQRSD